MKIDLTVNAIVENVSLSDCGKHFNIAAKVKDSGDVQMTILKKELIPANGQGDATISTGDIIAFNYSQNLGDKTTTLTSMHGAFVKAGETIPYARILLIKPHTESLKFPTAFTFPAT